MKGNHQESNPPFFPLPADGATLSSAESSPKELRSTKSLPINPATDALSRSCSSASSNLFASSQKIEIVFAQGHRLCLQGSFDVDELRTWLTPLLTLEK